MNKAIRLTKSFTALLLTAIITLGTFAVTANAAAACRRGTYAATRLPASCSRQCPNSAACCLLLGLNTLLREVGTLWSAGCQ